MSEPTIERRDELAANLAKVRGRIAGACAQAGRDPEEITVVVVTKFFPASDVRLLVELGITDIGENRHQEAEAKAAECRDLDVRWHFVGGLQSNKAAAVAAYSDVVESVDRAKLVRRLDSGAHGRSHAVDCLIQVSLDRAGCRRSFRGAADRRARPGRGHRVGRDALAARSHGRCAARCRPPRAVRAARGDPRGAGGRTPLRVLAVGRDERRSRGGDRGRRDTRSRWHRDPRIEATGQVVSKSQVAPHRAQEPPEESHERRDAQDR